MVALDAKGRIKRRWERWLEKQDWYTQGEIYHRDNWLRRPCLWLHGHGVSANRLTLWSAGFILIWMVLYDLLGINFLWLNIFFGTIIGLADAFDGSIARNNDNVTPKGALGDHFRDAAYILYMERIALDYGMPLYFLTLTVLVEVLTLYFKWCALYKYAGGTNLKERFLEFAEYNFQHTGYDRLQGIFSGAGLALFGIGTTYRFSTFEISGLGFMWISIGLGIASVYKEMRWIPPVEER